MNEFLKLTDRGIPLGLQQSQLLANLYLSDLDYDAFMAIVPQETDTSVIALKERTRKWSEYKDLLLNTYGLDSITDWYN